MTLITILFCLALQRFANIGGWLPVGLFEGYLRRLNPWLVKMNEWIGVFVIVAPVIVGLGILHFIFKWRLFGLFNLILALVVLLLCVDARDLKSKLQGYFTHFEKGDTEAAAATVADFVDEGAHNSAPELCRAVTKSILQRSFEQMFAGLFWFIVFNVYGVAAYTLIVLLRQTALKVDPNYVGLAKLAAHIQDFFDWIPSRLLGLSYALAGHFNKVVSYCTKNIWLSLSEVRKFPVDAGLAALDLDPNLARADSAENNAALELINRVLIIWLVAILLITIGMYL